MWTFATPISNPAGARCSARIFPVTMTLDSCVSPFSVSKASGFSLSAQTPWMIPVPSRKMGNISFPDSRKLYSQPRIVTSCPSYLPACSIVMIVIVRYFSEFSKLQFSREGRILTRARQVAEDILLGHRAHGAEARKALIRCDKRPIQWRRNKEGEQEKGSEKVRAFGAGEVSGVRRSGAYNLGTLFPAAPDENDIIECQVATNQS